jgi:hypothetical protein
MRIQIKLRHSIIIRWTWLARRALALHALLTGNGDSRMAAEKAADALF